MGAFFIVRTGKADRRQLNEKLEATMSRQGFGEPARIDEATFSVRVYKKLSGNFENSFIGASGDFSFVVGTFIYSGRTGIDALKKFHAEFDPKNIAWERIYGQFCLGIFNGSHLYLMTDRLGLYKVYIDRDRNVISSSFLTVMAALKNPTIDSQGTYEYVFQGATYGYKTIIEEIDILDGDHVVEIADRITKNRLESAPIAGFREGSIEEHLAINVENLRRYYKVIANCFDNNIDTALSGGYDSRLTLSLLREQGISPKVHVYGKATDGDVRVAREISAGEAFPLSQIDKSAFPPVEVSSFPNVVERNFLLFDGYPTDGIFDNGADSATRLERCANGELMLNGGGGEIFRNFYYLLDAKFSIYNLLDAFYSRYDPSVCTSRFSESEYVQSLAAKIRSTLGRDGDILDRSEIEYLYACFRCRFWMGRNNSVNSRLGRFLTPFVDLNIVKDAIAIPLRYKSHGLIEGRMIRAVGPELAKYPSVYGYSFMKDPSTWQKLVDMGTLARPTFIRRYTYRLKRSTHGKPPCYLEKPYLTSVIDARFPYMSNFVKIDRVTDPVQLARICTLEYLFEYFSPGIHG